MKARSALHRSFLERSWLEVCAVALGALYLYVGLLGTSAWNLTRDFGILGGLLLIASTAFHKVWLILSSVLIGTVPLAIVDWWSVVAPGLAVAAISTSFLRIRRIRESY